MKPLLKEIIIDVGFVGIVITVLALPFPQSPPTGDPWWLPTKLMIILLLLFAFIIFAPKEKRGEDDSANYNVA